MDYFKAYYQANKERIKARSAKRRLEKPDECKAAVERWHKDPANEERRRAYYREVVAKSEAAKRAKKKYHAKPETKAMMGAKARAYHIRKDQRMPLWLTEDHVDQINSIYKLASIYSNCLGRQLHVDHIVPLYGERVSGLHVPWNLQVIPSEENLSKGNTFIIC
jgi:5-methylcytosine-specific restriction endonuclease McrA